MEFARVHAGTPEQVFITVLNGDSVTMSSGRAAFWSLPLATDSIGTDSNGYRVAYGNTVATGTPDHPALFAGVVAIQDIGPGEFGRVQVYGPVNSVALYGTTTAPFVGAGAAWNAASLTNLVLRPLSPYMGITNATGMFGIQQLATTQTNVGALAFGSYYPGGYLVPYSSQFTTVSTNGAWTAGTLGTTGTGWCKAFVRCLG